ncbi:hypothetical protein WN943_006214 [Citrus x changshan-huyou]
MQQQNSESESTTCKALLIGLHGKIIAIRNQMQQLPPRYNDFDISEQSDKLIRLLIERQHQLDIKEFERGREELFDLLIEGHPRLAVVAILDSSAFDKLLLLQILTIIITSSSILTVMLGEIWDDLEEVLPDNQNGSRVLIMVTAPELLAPLEMENGETIRPDSVLIGGPMIRLKHES